MIRTLLCLCAVMVLLTGCTSLSSPANYTRNPKVPIEPPRGFIVTSIEAPLTANFESNKVCEKFGEDSVTYINPWCCTFGYPFPIAFGRCNIESAAQRGRLKTVEYADYEYFGILGLYNKLTIRAYGE